MSVPASGREPFPEEVYGLVCAAARQHRPMAAQYDGARRLFCPHVVGYNQPGEFRAFCYQYAGETKSGPLPVDGKGIWRCLSLKKLSRVELLDGPWQTEPHARQRCVDHVEVDADDYPGGDPQNGQRGSC
jgi:hypothetical protein